MFAEDFINNDIMDLCLLLCFCIFFKRQLECITKVFMSEVVVANLKIPEPKVALQIFYVMLLSKCGIRKIEKGNAFLLS